jgi:large subunit ribosomal protein L4
MIRTQQPQILLKKIKQKANNMELEIKNLFGSKTAKATKIKLPSCFLAEVREDIIAAVMNWQLNKRRSGNHKVKTISEIRGTTAKPFAQKGTGNARQGSKRSPQQRGGAIIFGPVVRSHSTKLNKKVRKIGLISALSYKNRKKQIHIISDPELSKVSSKTVNECLEKEDNSKILFIASTKEDNNFSLSIDNLKNINILDPEGLNVYDLINNNNIYISESALRRIQERLS